MSQYLTNAQYECGHTWAYGPYDVAADGTPPAEATAPAYCVTCDAPAFQVSSFPYTPPVEEP